MTNPSAVLNQVGRAGQWLVWNTLVYFCIGAVGACAVLILAAAYFAPYAAILVVQTLIFIGVATFAFAKIEEVKRLSNEPRMLYELSKLAEAVEDLKRGVVNADASAHQALRMIATRDAPSGRLAETETTRLYAITSQLDRLSRRVTQIEKTLKEQQSRRRMPLHRASEEAGAR